MKISVVNKARDNRVTKKIKAIPKVTKDKKAMSAVAVINKGLILIVKTPEILAVQQDRILIKILRVKLQKLKNDF
jgi:hypothetical protein